MKEECNPYHVGSLFCTTICCSEMLAKVNRHFTEASPCTGWPLEREYEYARSVVGCGGRGGRNYPKTRRAAAPLQCDKPAPRQVFLLYPHLQRLHLLQTGGPQWKSACKNRALACEDGTARAFIPRLMARFWMLSDAGLHFSYTALTLDMLHKVACGKDLTIPPPIEIITSTVKTHGNLGSEHIQAHHCLPRKHICGTLATTVSRKSAGFWRHVSCDVPYPREAVALGCGSNILCIPAVRLPNSMYL